MSFCALPSVRGTEDGRRHVARHMVWALSSPLIFVPSSSLLLQYLHTVLLSLSSGLKTKKSRARMMLQGI